MGVLMEIAALGTVFLCIYTIIETVNEYKELKKEEKRDKDNKSS